MVAYLQAQEYQFTEENFSSLEIKVVKNGNYTSKIFSSGVVVRYLSYAADVKCYEEAIEHKKMHIIKGNNAEISSINPDDILVVIGDNNFIYYKGPKQNIIVKGSNNYIYAPKTTATTYNPVTRMKKSAEIHEIARELSNKAINRRPGNSSSGVWDIWNSVSAYFVSSANNFAS